MSKIIALALVLCVSSGPAFAGFFNYQKPEEPVAGDCDQIASKIGPEATWYGEFAGTKVDDFNDWFYPWSGRGCFESKLACRVWQYHALDYMGRGYLVHMSCKQGLNHRY